jgi:hypothetical protein
MNNALIPTLLILVTLSAMPLHAESYKEQALKKDSTTTTTHTKRYSSQSADQEQRSRKCAIYSGICPMSRRAKVGDYCICHTPSGPIHGVVIP